MWQEFLLALLFILLLFFMTFVTKSNHKICEGFTIPSLTLGNAPSWFPQNSAKAYNPNDWKVKMYLDKYPFYDPIHKKYINYNESQQLASTNRFWRD